jgi:hypothetical protein
MRNHGVPSYSDPPAVTGSNGNHEARLPPGVNVESPAFQSAAKDCGGGPKGPL